MLLCCVNFEENNRLSYPGFNENWFIPVAIINRNAESGDGPENSPGLKMTRMKFKVHVGGNLGAGIMNPVSDVYDFEMVQSYSDYMPHCHFTAAASRRREKSRRNFTFIYNQSRVHANIHEKSTKPRNEL